MLGRLQVQWLYPMGRAPTNIQSSAATHRFFQYTFYAHCIPFRCSQFPAIILTPINLSEIPGFCHLKKAKVDVPSSYLPSSFLKGLALELV